MAWRVVPDAMAGWVFLGGKVRMHHAFFFSISERESEERRVRMVKTGSLEKTEATGGPGDRCKYFLWNAAINPVSF
jgi:hypothetical protein